MKKHLYTFLFCIICISALAQDGPPIAPTLVSPNFTWYKKIVSGDTSYYGYSNNNWVNFARRHWVQKLLNDSLKTRSKLLGTNLYYGNQFINGKITSYNGLLGTIEGSRFYSGNSNEIDLATSANNIRVSTQKQLQFQSTYDGTAGHNGTITFRGDTIERTDGKRVLFSNDIPAELNMAQLSGPIFLAGNAVNAMEPITKNQFDNYVTGITWKQEVKAATTTNISLLGTQTLDGVALAINDRVLVKNQASPAQNGLYLVKSTNWIRTVDADAPEELFSATVLVRLGVINKNTQWTCTNITNPLLETDTVTFGQLSGAGTYTNGTGLTLSANVFDVNYSVLDNRYGKLSGGNTWGGTQIFEENVTAPLFKSGSLASQTGGIDFGNGDLRSGSESVLFRSFRRNGIKISGSLGAEIASFNDNNTGADNPGIIFNQGLKLNYSLPSITPNNTNYTLLVQDNNPGPQGIIRGIPLSSLGTTGSGGTTYTKTEIDAITATKEALLTHNNQQLYIGNGTLAVQTPNLLFDAVLNKFNISGILAVTRNVADASATFSVSQTNASSTGNLQEWNFNGQLKARVSQSGTYYGGGINNNTNPNYSAVTVRDDGTNIIRNIADNSPTLTVNAGALTTAGSNILQLQTNGNNRFTVSTDGNASLTGLFKSNEAIILGGRFAIGGSTTAASNLYITGGQTTSTVFGLAGFGIQQTNAIYTSSGSSGTIGNAAVNTFGIGTLAASSATTLTKAFGNVFNSPSAGANVTIGTALAAGFNGSVEVTGAMNVGGRFSINTLSGQTAVLQLGNTSNFNTNGVFSLTGPGIAQSSLTYNSTTANGTISAASINSYLSGTFASANITTITEAFGNYFQAPVGSSNVTIGKSYAAGYAGDVLYINNATGPVIKSPDGTKYRITVSNGGVLSATPL
jgi:hypothetical protein